MNEGTETPDDHGAEVANEVPVDATPITTTPATATQVDATSAHRAPVDVTPTDLAPRPPGVSARTLVVETVLVLGVSLGSSAVYAVLSFLRKITAQVALSQQTTAMNSSVTPDRPWLDLAYQLSGVILGVVPALLAVYLLRRDDAGAARRIGADLRRPLADLGRGALLAAAIGIPGLVLYLVARELGLNTTVAAANLAQVWWAVPVLVLAAVQNAVLEEVVMIGYLFTRWRQAGWSWWATALTSALVRGTYHLYQGVGGFVGNLAMGLIVAFAYRRWGRVGPLVVAHTILDVVAFVGYSLLAGRVGWL